MMMMMVMMMTTATVRLQEFHPLRVSGNDGTIGKKTVKIKYNTRLKTVML
jgi:hypothetical protein